MQISGAQAIVQCLLEQGVKTVFGYPGGQVLPLYDALYDAPIFHITTVHEQGAAHAADGYARAGGGVGVCIATSGPGATNLLTGLAAAYMDSIPVVAITGQVPTALLGRDSFQEVDITGITMPVTKYNFQVKSVDKLAKVMAQAFHIARSGRPGPVLVDVPRDVQTAMVDYISAATLPQEVYVPDGAGENQIKNAAAAIRNATRPVLIAGGGAVAAGVDKPLRELMEKCGIPAVSTLMGLGAISGYHPQFLGMTGMHGHKAANFAVLHADVILAVGCRFSDRMTGNRSVYTRGKTVVQIDIDPAEINKNVDAHIGLSGDAKKIVPELLKRIEERDNGPWLHTVSGWRKHFCFVCSKPQLTAAWVMQEINRQTRGQNYLFSVDVGQHQMWAAQQLKIEEPRTWLTSGGLGAMGFALPAAMGAQMAQPQKRVVHIAGDGGFQMTGAELYTIAAHRMPVISVIINNHRLGMIRQLQHVFFERRYYQCDMPYHVDFAAFAAAFAVHAVRVETKEEFARAFSAARQTSAPEVIVVEVKGEDFVEPMLSPAAPLTDYVEF
jgi:acetolactate synthase-1/2/3 large subunit